MKSVTLSASWEGERGDTHCVLLSYTGMERQWKLIPPSGGGDLYFTSDLHASCRELAIPLDHLSSFKLVCASVTTTTVRRVRVQKHDYRALPVELGSAPGQFTLRFKASDSGVVVEVVMT